MALTALGKIATVNVDLSTAVYSDETVYGAPEVDRNQVGVLAYIVKKDREGEESDANAIGNTADPATDDEWTFDYEIDGWFRAYMFIVPNYSAITTYSIDQAVYDTVTGKFYQSVTNSNTGNAVTDITSWSEIPTPAKTLTSIIDLANEPDNIDRVVVDDILRGFTSLEYSKFVEADALLQPQEFEPGASTEIYWVLDMLMEGMSTARSRSLWTDGEKIARKAEEVIRQC